MPDPDPIEEPPFGGADPCWVVWQAARFAAHAKLLADLVLAGTDVEKQQKARCDHAIALLTAALAYYDCVSRTMPPGV